MSEYLIGISFPICWLNLLVARVDFDELVLEIRKIYAFVVSTPATDGLP